jgi:hypothetical protein
MELKAAIDSLNISAVEALLDGNIYQDLDYSPLEYLLSTQKVTTTSELCDVTNLATMFVVYEPDKIDLVKKYFRDKTSHSLLLSSIEKINDVFKIRHDIFGECNLVFLIVICMCDPALREYLIQLKLIDTNDRHTCICLYDTLRRVLQIDPHEVNTSGCSIINIVDYYNDEEIKLIILSEHATR